MKAMRVIVVGAGVVGLCCAWYLARDGASVTMLDGGEPGGGATGDVDGAQALLEGDRRLVGQRRDEAAHEALGRQIDGAPAVVVHLGFPEGCPRRSKPLIELYNEGKKATAEYQKEKDELLKEREFYKAKGFTAGLLSLKEINSYAFKKKIKIGLETRMFYEEFPNLEEFQYIFKEFSGGALYYWHDIGHAEIHGRLGFTTPEEYLSNLKKHLIGLHIHDMRGISDHRAPGTGDVYYHKYLPWLKDPALIKVFELHPFNSREEVIAGRQLLEKLCGESDKNYDRLL